MQFLLTFHGEVRWFVALMGAAVILRFTYGALARARFGGLDRGLMTAFTVLLDLNLLLGLILLFGLPGGMIASRMEHATTMILAVVAAHLSALWRRSEDDARRFRGSLIVVVIALVLVVVGVVRLRDGWLFL